MIEFARDTYRYRELIWALALKELRVRYKRSLLGFFWALLYLPVPMLGLFLFTQGAAFFFATANVFYRDVSHIVQILLSAWFYFSPIIYSLDFIPEKYRWLFRLNPMLYVLNGFRLSIYYGQLPSLYSAALSLGCGIAALMIGFSIFRHYQNRFIYYI